ncbi:MAG: hypothetical protein L3K07_09370 [Thermoplasmata archaeon]|nr:hypothetical protein [Thermoplasmata archaeon]
MTDVCPKCNHPAWQVWLNRRTVRCCHCRAHFHLKEVSGYQLAALRKRLGLEPLPPRAEGVP